MTQSAANQSLSTCQPVDTLTAVDKWRLGYAAVDKVQIIKHRFPRLIGDKDLIIGVGHLGIQLRSIGRRPYVFASGGLPASSDEAGSALMNPGASCNPLLRGLRGDGGKLLA
jgi:hypothetical protein